MELDVFLQQQASEGSLDSDGSFMVSLSQARDKLVKFRLPATNYYLVKMIQAAIRGGATSVQLSMGRSHTWIWFDVDLDSPLADFDTIKEGMIDLVGLEPGPVRHLVIALATTQALENKGVSYAVLTSDQAQVWNLSGSYSISVKKQKTELQEGKVRCRFEVNDTRSYLARLLFAEMRADDYRLVSNLCRFAPVPVKVDAVDVRQRFGPSGSYPSGLWCSGTRRMHLVEDIHQGQDYCAQIISPTSFVSRKGWYLWKGADWGRDDRLLPTPGATSCFCFRILNERKEVEQRGRLPKRVPARLLLALDTALRDTSELTLVYDGVVVSSTRESMGCPGLVMMGWGEGLKVDLSEFGVLKDRAYQDFLSLLKPLYRDLMEYALRRKEYFKPVSDMHLSQYHGWPREHLMSNLDLAWRKVKKTQT